MELRRGSNGEDGSELATARCTVLCCAVMGKILKCRVIYVRYVGELEVGGEGLGTDGAGWKFLVFV